MERTGRDKTSPLRESIDPARALQAFVTIAMVDKVDGSVYHPNKHVLDIGCGSILAGVGVEDFLTRKMGDDDAAKRIFYMDVVAAYGWLVKDHLVDQKKASEDHADRRFIVGDFRRGFEAFVTRFAHDPVLPKPLSGFDVVILANVLHFYTNETQIRAITAALSFVRNGGSLVFDFSPHSAMKNNEDCTCSMGVLTVATSKPGERRDYSCMDRPEVLANVCWIGKQDIDYMEKEVKRYLVDPFHNVNGMKLRRKLVHPYEGPRVDNLCNELDMKMLQKKYKLDDMAKREQVRLELLEAKLDVLAQKMIGQAQDMITGRYDMALVCTITKA